MSFGFFGVKGFLGFRVLSFQVLGLLRFQGFSVFRVLGV